MIKTRFAPSPTGTLHIGGARTALFSWLYARKNNGKFILRIEDTDRERSSDISINAILESMDWLGLDYDEGPFYQTQRFDRYNEVIENLISNNLAYRCNCSTERLDQLRNSQIMKNIKPKYDGRCRNIDCDRGEPHVVRFKNPEFGDVEFQDLVKGKIKFNNQELDDLIIRRTDGSPTYNLTVVVDDHDMDITHIIRGDDHINNTPRQINLYSALNWNIPEFAHLPMILGKNGERLSKRHGAAGVMEYKKRGYLPDAILNNLVRLGWSHGDQEIFSIEEMIAKFSFDSINNSASSFNEDKLNWLNSEHIKNKNISELSDLVISHFQKKNIKIPVKPVLADLIKIQRERATTLIDLTEIIEFFYFDPYDFNQESTKKAYSKQVYEYFSDILERLQGLEKWRDDLILDAIKNSAEKLGVKYGKVAFPVRIAITGGKASPDLSLVLSLVGKEATLRRIKRAMQFIYENNYE